MVYHPFRWVDISNHGRTVLWVGQNEQALVSIKHTSINNLRYKHPMSLDKRVAIPDTLYSNSLQVVKSLSVVHRQTYLTCASVVSLTSNFDGLKEPGFYPLDRTIPFQSGLIELGNQILGKSPSFIRLIHFGSGHQMYNRECDATTFITFVALPLFRRISTSSSISLTDIRQGQVIKMDAGTVFRCTSDRPSDLVDDTILLEFIA